MNEENIIRKVLEDIDLSADVQKYEVSFSPDSTGMPSVYIKLHIADDFHPSKEKISRLSRLRRAITDKLLDQGLDNYPYVKLVAE